VCVCVCVCVCVYMRECVFECCVSISQYCVCVREKERERERKSVCRVLCESMVYMCVCMFYVLVWELSYSLYMRVHPRAGECRILREQAQAHCGCARELQR
jgi:hypothetical protein